MNFLIVLSLFISQIFPIILSIFGLSWVSSDESPLYKICVLGCNGLVIIYILLYEIWHHKQSRGSILPYFIPVLFIIYYLFESSIAQIPLGDNSHKIFQYFLAFSTSGIFAATYCNRYAKLHLIFKNLELLLFICAFALIAAFPKLLIQSTIDAIGGANHQNISYTSALAFGVIYCSLTNVRFFKPYKIFAWRYYPFIAIPLLFLLCTMCLIGGGRGGTVLLIFNFIICTWAIAKKHILKFILIISAAALLVSCISTLIPENLQYLFDNGFERAFAFINPEGNIDLANGSSGRDRVYDESINLIIQHPLSGYGIFRQYDLCVEYIKQPYAHNLFLETLLQTGFIGLLIMIIIIAKFLNRLIKLVSYSKNYVLLLPLASYPLVLLQFSGTYLLTPSFWFVLVVTFGYYHRICRYQSQLHRIGIKCVVEQ